MVNERNENQKFAIPYVDIFLEMRWIKRVTLQCSERTRRQMRNRFIESEPGRKREQISFNP
jgi:hypothetical protein